MAVSRGKQFEQIVKEAFEKVEGCSIDRIHDQTNGFAGSKNICDFIAYKYPYEYYIECKTVHGGTFPLSNLTDNQYNGLVEKSKIHGVISGVLCWWVDKDITRFIPISTIQTLKANNYKSVAYNLTALTTIEVKGKKKRVFFDYDIQRLFRDLEYNYKLEHKEKEALYGRFKLGRK